jgi:hypothetical protein
MISGEKSIQWVLSHWPLDIYATAILICILIPIFFIALKRVRPDLHKKIETFVFQSFSGLFYICISIVSLPWVILRGLIMEQGLDGKYKFAGFKMMFMLCSFIMLSRVAVSGVDVNDVNINVDIPSKDSSKKNIKIKKRKKKASKSKKHKKGIFVKRINFSSIGFYEVLVFLIFCLMYYYRADLNEGDTNDGLDKLIDTAKNVFTLKYGGKTDTIEEKKVETISSDGSVKKEEIKKTSRRRRKNIFSEEDDPFLNR